jgi:hypothetical protein
MEKLGNVQESMDNANIKKKTLRNNQKEILEIKYTVIQMRNTFEGLSSGLNMAKESSTKEEESADLPELKC